MTLLQLDGKEIAVPDRAVTVLTRLRAAAGHEAAVRGAAADLVAQTRTEEGCLLCVAHAGVDRPGDVVFYVVFRDRAAYESHQASRHLADWLDELNGSAAGGLDVQVMTTLPGPYGGVAR